MASRKHRSRRECPIKGATVFGRGHSCDRKHEHVNGAGPTNKHVKGDYPMGGIGARDTYKPPTLIRERRLACTVETANHSTTDAVKIIRRGNVEFYRVVSDADPSLFSEETSDLATAKRTRVFYGADTHSIQKWTQRGWTKFKRI